MLIELESQKIIHILPWYSPANTGGTEIYLVNLCKQLVLNGIETSILCPSLDDVEHSFYVDGILVIATPYLIINAKGDVDTGRKAPPNLRLFVALIKKLNPSILHFHCLWPKHIYYLKEANALGIKTVVTPHLAGFSCLKSDLIYKNKSICNGEVTVTKCTACLQSVKIRNDNVLLAILKHFSIFIFRLKINLGTGNKITRLISVPFIVNDQLRFLKMTELFATSIVAISSWYKEVLNINGIPSTLIETYIPPNNIFNAENQTNGPLKIMYAGRQSVDKGLDILLRSLLKLDKSKFQLYIFGQESSSDWILKNISSLQKQGYLIYQNGNIANKELLSRMKQMDLLCFPSSMVEMAPLTIKEAFSLGIPVIGTEIGGIRDDIKNGKNGFLFKWKDPADLADKLNLMINDSTILNDMKKYIKDSEHKVSLYKKYIFHYNNL